MSRNCVLGYVCINEDDLSDRVVCKDLGELFEKPGIDCLPIIDNARYTSPCFTNMRRDYGRKLPQRQRDQEPSLDGIQGVCPVVGVKRVVEEETDTECRPRHPVKVFLKEFPTENPRVQDESSVRVITNRRVLRELISDDKQMRFPSKKIRLIVRVWNDSTLGVSYDKSHDGQFIEFGIYVEDYLTNKIPNRKRYKVFSVHSLVDFQHNTHYMYSSEIDAFILETNISNHNQEITSVLTPVEIKCVHPSDIQRSSPAFKLQAYLGQVTKIVLVHYELEGRFAVTKGKEMIKGNFAKITKCETMDVADAWQELPLYRDECISRLSSQLTAYAKEKKDNPNSSSSGPGFLKMVVEKQHGRVSKIEVVEMLNF